MQDMTAQLAALLSGGQGTPIPQAGAAMMPATIQRQNIGTFQPAVETANVGAPLVNNQVTTVAQTAAKQASAPAAGASSGATNKKKNRRGDNPGKLTKFEKNMNKAAVIGPKAYTNAQEQNLGVNNDTIGYGLNPNKTTSGMVNDRFTDLFAGRPPQKTWGNPNGLRPNRTNVTGTGGPMTPTQQSGMAGAAAAGAESLPPIDPLDETAKLPSQLF